MGELDERLGFRELIDEHLTDFRANNARFSLADLLRQSVYGRLAGYEDVNDAERLSQDPTFRLIGSEWIGDRGAALTSRLQTFETEMLAKDENFTGLARVNRELIRRAEALDSQYRFVLDMDLTEIPAYGGRSTVPTTGTSNRPAFTRCCCSMETATVWRRSCVQAAFTVPRVGKSFCCRESSDSSRRKRVAESFGKSGSVPMDLWEKKSYSVGSK